MLFNSLIFIFAFLPVSLGGYYLLCATPLKPLRFAFLSLMSMVFYAHASWLFAVLLALSTAANLGLALLIQRLRDAGRTRAMQAVLMLGVTGNLLFLGYFKYTDFFLRILNGALGLRLPLQHLPLPIGISFYTFLFMASLADVARREIGKVRPDEFVSFSLFYPHLLAGPIVHYQELVPQMAVGPFWRRVPAHMVVGLAIFAIGLFKKTVLADTLAIYANRIFPVADAGGHPGVVSSWLGALGFTLQIYFDFSGYSDMAIGLSRLFGFRLPLNFHSPLKSANIVDYWRRWHMTLQRFIVAYLYPALAIPLTRWSVDRRMGDWVSFAVSVAMPTILTFVVVGFWHGAGWTYLLFGLMHGLYITVCEAWRKVRRNRRWRKVKVGRAETLAAHVLLLLAVIVAHVVFRAKTLAGAFAILGGMAGLGAGPEVAAPYAALGPWTNLVFVVLGYAFVLTLPNTQQIMGRYSPALDWDKWRKVAPPLVRLGFRPTPAWALAIGLILFLGIAFVMRGQTEFIYFRF